MDAVAETIDLEAMFQAKNNTHVLRARGEAMIEDHICDGDYVVIERKDTAANGDQAVVLTTDGQCTLRRVYFEDGKVRLQPANKAMSPRIVDRADARIQGVVIGVLRSYH